MVAIIGGQPARFRPLVDLYREAGRRAGHDPAALQVGLHCFGFVGDTDQAAADAFYPGWAQMFTKIGKERGFGAPVRAQYDAMLRARTAPSSSATRPRSRPRRCRSTRTSAAWPGCRCR